MTNDFVLESFSRLFMCVSIDINIEDKKWWTTMNHSKLKQEINLRYEHFYDKFYY